MNCPTKNPLQRDGISQYHRALEALQPSSAPIHEYSLKDWMIFVYQYATRLKYYNASNDAVEQGDWHTFMISDDDLDSFLSALDRQDFTAATEPHLALFISFIRLLTEPTDPLKSPALLNYHDNIKDQLNHFTQRHLDFYYRNVLQLTKKEAVEDKVHLVFELAKNIPYYKLADDTLFDAGKDKTNKPLEYIVDDEPVIYPSKVALLKSIFHQKKFCVVRFAEIANSADGSGAAFSDGSASWYPFGFDKTELGKNSGKTVSLPAAKLGFALSSSILLLKEGQRTITVTLDLSFPSGIDYSAFSNLHQQLVVLLTGEKDWVSPLSVSVNPPSLNQQRLIITVVIDKSEKGIIGYDPTLHKENYTTNLPVIRFLLETSPDKGYNAYYELSKATIRKASISVDVTNMKDLILENDDGKIDPAKPFLPFGAVPRKGSDFFVGSNEIFDKKWSEIKLAIAWKGKPDDLGKHYVAYRTPFLKESFTRNSYDVVSDKNGNITASEPSEVTGEDYFKADVAFIKNGRWSDGSEVSLFTTNPITISGVPTLAQNPQAVDYGFKQLYTTGYDRNKSYVLQYLSKSLVKPAFDFATFNPGFASGIARDNSFSAGTKNNFLRIKLETAFFHQQFPSLYAAAITNPGAVIPKEPYTPVISSLDVSYKASIENDFVLFASTSKQRLDNYTKRDIQLFHEAPFGQAEQHIFLREQNDFLEKKPIELLPTYPSEGELLIALDNAVAGTQVNILFQVAEGSENPSAKVFEKQQQIRWGALCNNEWKPLNENFIIADDTNNFLRPGIIQFLLPRECTTINTVLPANFIWLKASLPEGISFDAVCKFVDVLAQADVAKFKNNGNELSHLSTGLRGGSISKMINKQAAVKSVKQPFSSFGGLPEETDDHFYTRVSERLRHKNRAVNIWDYEHLVLEKFPSVHKVKCHNHTKIEYRDNEILIYEFAPGHTLITPIPDLRNKNIYNIFQPGLSKNVLTEIQNYLQELHGVHVICQAENPDYEEVQFDLNVKFNAGYDPKAYAKILEDDLRKYLAPWAFSDNANIDFGGTIYKSRVIAFIEEKGYVDFISEFKMYNLAIGLHDEEEIVAASSRAILTSASTHNIIPLQPPVCA